MHGLGNDFVVINGLDQPFEPAADLMRHIADRRRGVGCDQVLLIEESDSDAADFRYRIFNADGNEVEQCGNGVRCIGKYLENRELLQKPTASLMTCNGLMTIHYEQDGQVRVDMGAPVFEPRDIPLALDERQSSYEISQGDVSLQLMAVSMGNPHAVLLVEDVDKADVEFLGPLVQSQPLFPNGVNVGFMQVVDTGAIRLRVYERGVGETDACGSGACAAVATGINAGRLGPEVVVSLNGGDLKINWDGEGQPLWMTGPAVTVYEGQIEI